VRNSAAGVMSVMSDNAVCGMMGDRPNRADKRKALNGHIGLCADGARAKSSG
jgi:hypothetical protein